MSARNAHAITIGTDFMVKSDEMDCCAMIKFCTV
jgi:hypothetical protein